MAPKLSCDGKRGCHRRPFPKIHIPKKYSFLRFFVTVLCFHIVIYETGETLEVESGQMASYIALVLPCLCLFLRQDLM